MDLRIRVVASRDAGTGKSEITEAFDVSVSWVMKLLKRYRETGQMGPIAQRHGPVRKLAAHEEELNGIVEAEPDRTLREIAAKLSVKACVQTVNVPLNCWAIAVEKVANRCRAEASFLLGFNST